MISFNLHVSQSEEYGRTRRDLVHAETILAACIACNTICCTRIRVHAHRKAKYQKDASFKRISSCSPVVKSPRIFNAI